jgi:hypothetical protein
MWENRVFNKEKPEYKRHSQGKKLKSIKTTLENVNDTKAIPKNHVQELGLTDVSRGSHIKDPVSSHPAPTSIFTI